MPVRNKKSYHHGPSRHSRGQSGPSYGPGDPLRSIRDPDPVHREYNDQLAAYLADQDTMRRAAARADYARRNDPFYINRDGLHIEGIHL